MAIKNLKNILSEKIMKHGDNLNRIKGFFLIILGYGLIINYALLIIFQIPFKLYGFPAFGIAYYFVTEEFTVLFRKLKARNIQ